MDDLNAYFNDLSIDNLSVSIQRILSNDVEQLVILYYQIISNPNEFEFILESNDIMDIELDSESVDKIYKTITKIGVTKFQLM
jgi:hypothetical protein